MNWKSSLSGRAFIFSFVPLCVVLIAGSLALSSAVKQRVKESLRESLQKSEIMVARANGAAAQREGQFIQVLAESPELKASIGLLAEASRNPQYLTQVRATLEAQLADIHKRVGYELLAITDWQGRLVAAMEYHDGTPRSISNIPDTPAKLTLSVVADELYEIRTAAITLDQGQVGSLKLGSRFDLRRYNMAGDMALLRRGKILRATFPQAKWAPIEKRRAGCTQKNDCEILRAEETLLAMPVP